MEPLLKPVCTTFDPFSIDIQNPKKGLTSFSIKRPSPQEVTATAAVAKDIFVEAFQTSYTHYFNESQAGGTIEQWLKIKSGLKVWLSETFDEEYQDFLSGRKGFIHLIDSNNQLVGWASHSPIDDKGCVYLSQCSLEGEWRNQRVATEAFHEIFHNNQIFNMFPQVKEVKLIVRKINQIAQRLYTRAGFTCDETIKPEIYGEAYDERYVGFRKAIEGSK